MESMGLPNIFESKAKIFKSCDIIIMLRACSSAG